MYLLDTNVIAELTKPNPTQGVLDWLNINHHTTVYLSVITIGEIRQGIERLAVSKRKTTLLSWLEDGLLVDYAQYILPIDLETINIWGELTARLILQGKTMQAMDSFIAATAAHHELAVVTRNTSDFKDAGVDLINPWDIS